MHLEVGGEGFYIDLLFYHLKLRALRDSNKPIGVAESQLVEARPKELEENLPSIEQIEREFAEPKRKP